MSAPSLLLWLDDAGPYLQAIEAAGLTNRLRITTLKRSEALTDALLADTEILMGWGAPPGTLTRMPKLRWIQALTAGVEHWLDRADLTDAITLTCARGTHRVQMPENILGALFHITKPFHAIAEDQKAHRWTRRVSTTLAGKTLGVLGLGAIGQELAPKAAALELRVIGTRRSGGTVPGVDKVYTPDQTDEVLRQSDFVLLLLPVTAETNNFINAERLAMMKPDAWLLNFGRGQLIVDEDLIAAVKQKRIAGAVLDVFRQEPLPAEHPFWGTEGISVLPHIGGLHPQRDSVVAALLVQNLKSYLAGQPMQTAVDRRIGY